MTVSDITRRVNALRPETENLSTVSYIRYINDLQAILYKNIISKHKTGIMYRALDDDYDDGYVDTEAELILPDEYADMYVYYIAAQCDLGKGETTRYNNTMALYNTLYQRYADYINREYMPIQRAKITVGGM